MNVCFDDPLHYQPIVSGYVGNDAIRERLAGRRIHVLNAELATATANAVEA